MPIKPENRARYPKDWQAIRARILERAGDRCETCGIENGAWVIRAQSGEIVWRNTQPYEPIGATDRLEETLHLASSGARSVRIVLTIAHIDPTPENCDPSNLVAECQRCHNRRDAPMRAKNAAETRKAKRP